MLIRPIIVEIFHHKQMMKITGNIFWKPGTKKISRQSEEMLKYFTSEKLNLLGTLNKVERDVLL